MDDWLRWGMSIDMMNEILFEVSLSLSLAMKLE